MFSAATSIRSRSWCVRMVVVLTALAIAMAPAFAGEADATFVLVRHAEKVDDSRDPELSPAGAARARALAAVLERANVDVVYVSQYQRTRLTALPAARAADLTPVEDPVGDDLNVWASSFAERLLTSHSGETVLVVGHSNTIPLLAAALCGCDVAPLSDSDYDRLFIVNAGGDRPPSLIEARYGAR